MMQKEVVVVGGGIVGLFCAYYLRQEGHRVIVLDKGDMNSGASYVNAGYLTPSHIVPLAAPGMVTKGLKWMFNSSSPFYIQPRLNLDLMDWGLKFMRSCTKQHVQRSLGVIKDINVLSKELYADLNNSPAFDFHLEERGVLMAFQTTAAEKEEAEVMREAQALGLDVSLIDRAEVQALQPKVEMDIAGAYHYRCDAHSTPSTVLEQLKQQLEGSGVELHKNTAVQSLKTQGAKVTAVVTDKGEFLADEVVIASGAWTQQLLKAVGIHLPIQAGKGYSLNEEKPTGISMPAILMEAKVAVTPMQGFTRFSGTMEIAGVNHKIRKNRVNAIAAAAEAVYGGLKISDSTKAEVQCGLRPLSPDGLPFVGKTNKYANLSLASGHSMMGWSLGPVTGKLIAELLSEKKTSLDLSPFSPDRTYG